MYATPQAQFRSSERLFRRFLLRLIMGDGSAGYGTGAVVDRLRVVVEDPGEGRPRATWRVLIAGLVMFPLTETVSQLAAGARGLPTPAGIGTVQAACFAVVLVAWARYIDRRRLGEYGFAATPAWALDLLAGFAAVLIAWVLWFGVGAALDWTTVKTSPSTPDGSLVLALGGWVVAYGLNAWVQETVFQGLVLKNVAEGFRNRGVTARRAVLGALAVTAAYFAVIHGETSLRFLIDLTVAGAVYGALYVHTGSLALPVGAHLGANLVSGTVFAPASVVGDRVTVFVVSGGVPGPELLNLAFTRMVLAYLLLLGYLWLRHGEVGVETRIAAWTPR
jgi:membrane protease YdiL (CAAX protease family)